MLPRLAGTALAGLLRLARREIVKDTALFALVLQLGFITIHLGAEAARFGPVPGETFFTAICTGHGIDYIPSGGKTATTSCVICGAAAVAGFGFADQPAQPSKPAWFALATAAPAVNAALPLRRFTSVDPIRGPPLLSFV